MIESPCVRLNNFHGLLFHIGGLFIYTILTFKGNSLSTRKLHADGDLSIGGSFSVRSGYVKSLYLNTILK
ncbi:MAG: hypothetical protein D8M58_21550 [Calditrichaeota bacterium]|nr:MAG: hypothetical protein DWQ03_17015 [Calditrichota bacterium]MBL1208000.1 hypothetical protein [Calditrichota bacterium]